MDVVVVGAGLMGSQIAAEYALAGDRVHCLARSPAAAAARVDAALAMDVRLGVHDVAAARAAAGRLTAREAAGGAGERIAAGEALGGISRCELVVESGREDLALKGEVLSPIASRFPAAV